MSARELLGTWTAWFEGLGDERFAIVRTRLVRALGERRYADLPSLADQICRAMLVDPERSRTEIGCAFGMLEDFVHSLRPALARNEVQASAVVAITDLINAFASGGTLLPTITDEAARSLLGDLTPERLSEDERLRAGLAALALGDRELTRRFDTDNASLLHAFFLEMSSKRDPVLYPQGFTVMPIVDRSLAQGIDAVTLLWLGRLVYGEVMGGPAGHVVRETRGHVESAIRHEAVMRQAKAQARADDEAAAVAFPHGALIAAGAFRIMDKLRGIGSQQLWRAVRLSDGREALVAFDNRFSRSSIDEMRVAVAACPAIGVELAFAGEVDPPHPGSHWLCVELPVRGSWLPDLLAEGVSSAEAIELGRSAGRLLAQALSGGDVLTHVRPEYMWGTRDGQRIDVVAASVRAHELFRRKEYDLVTWPLFEHSFAAPEAAHAPTDRSLVYSLAKMIVDWAGGAPASIAALVERALSEDPADRPGLDSFLGELGND